MSLTFADNRVVLADYVTVEEAESLLEWLLAHPQASLDLSALKHLHAANLQVLMAAGNPVSAWPADPDLAAWLRASLPTQEK